MQAIVFDRPYRFVAPQSGAFWQKLLRPLVGPYLKRYYGVVDVQFRGEDRLAGSLAAGHGILLASNHCRDCDPLVISQLSRALGCNFFLMASAHLFMQGRVMAWILPRVGAFSIYREGMDRQAVSMATDILAEAKRPLIMFPEGVVSRANDRLNALMEGVTLITRAAARRRAKLTPAGKVVVHPIGVRYHFRGDIQKAASAVLGSIEQRLSWRAQNELPLVQRIAKLGEAMLSLKEIEHMGGTQEGSLPQRLQRLIDHLLKPLEAEWLAGKREGATVARVKRLRMAILPDMAAGNVSDAERKRRWRQLADAYLAQQLALYPPNYLDGQPSAERILETVERLEEDLTDTARIHKWLTATVTVGEAIEVSTAREGRGGSDTLLARVEQGMREALGIEGCLAETTCRTEP